MQPLLFLAHRLPYPPNKGDKIRSYHLLKYLSQRYRVFLGTFIDDPEDWCHIEAVKALCEEVYVRPLKPYQATLKSLKGFITGEALSIPYYRDVKLQCWVDRCLKQARIRQALVFSSPMAQFVRGTAYSHLRRIVDLVDVDSDKWRQYSHSKKWPLSWVYEREGEYLERFECELVSEFDASLLVSQDEAALLRKLTPIAADKIGHYNNGVDMDYFDPGLSFDRPYKVGEKVLVFTGAMNYWANADAAIWFANDVFPLVLEKIPEARFYIVGIYPTESVQDLSKLPGIIVTGKVPDMRPFLAHAHVAVAPMRIARGVQNKVLEAMAMGCPVVSSPSAIEGIEACPGLDYMVTDDAQRFADICISLLHDGDINEIGATGRKCMEKYYNWGLNLSRLSNYLH